MSIYILVADSSGARFLCTPFPDEPLRDERDFIHPNSRLRDQDLVTDSGGSGFNSGGHGRHSMGHEQSTHDHEAQVFARELCAELEKIRVKGDLHRFYLVAPPRFLGLLRAALSKPCAELVAGEVDKDMVKFDLDAIRAQLPRRL